MKKSVIVKALADMASQGKYDNVTPLQARNMNALFIHVARLINELEQEEADAEEQCREIMEEFHAAEEQLVKENQAVQAELDLEDTNDGS